MGKRFKANKVVRIDPKELASKFDGRWALCDGRYYRMVFNNDSILFINLRDESDQFEVIKVYSGLLPKEYFIFTRDGRAGSVQEVPFYILVSYHCWFYWMDEFQTKLIKEVIREA